MKINSLLESQTTSSAVSNTTTSAPKFGRDDEHLEECGTTAGVVGGGPAVSLGTQRRGTGALLKGIKTSEKFPNSKSVKETTFNRAGYNPLRDKKDYLDKRDHLQQQLNLPGLSKEDRDYIRQRILDLEFAAKKAGLTESWLGDRSWQMKMNAVHDVRRTYGADLERDEFMEQLWNYLDQQYGPKVARAAMDDSDLLWMEYTDPMEGVAEGLNEFAPPEGSNNDDRNRRLRKLLEIAIKVAEEQNVGTLGMVHAMNTIAGDDFFSVAVEGILPDITDKEYTFILQSAYKTVKQGNVEEGSMGDELAQMAMKMNPKALVRKDGVTLQEPPKREVPQPAPVDVEKLQQAYNELKEKYKQLGGDSWQYADRMMPRDYEAQQVQQQMNNIARQIMNAQKGQIDEAEISEEMLAHELYKDLQIFKKATDKTIGKKSKSKDLSDKPKDKEIISKVEKSKVSESVELGENLHQWFKEKWVRFGPDGKIRGACARGDDSEGKPKCLPQAKAHALGKKGRKYAASKKRREDPNPERRGPAKNVATKKKSNEDMAEGVAQNLGREAFNKKQGKESNPYHKTREADKHKEWNLGHDQASKDTHDATRFRKSVAEEQLDELKCWPGYTRVRGVPAGAPGSCKKKTNEQELDEKWSQKYKDSINCSNPKGFSQKAHCAGKKKNEDIKEEYCPECGGPMFSELMINEKKDACYYKVKSRYKVWPSAYASGALVKCRKSGASNWGNKSKK